MTEQSDPIDDFINDLEKQVDEMFKFLDDIEEDHRRSVEEFEKQIGFEEADDESADSDNDSDNDYSTPSKPEDEERER